MADFPSGAGYHPVLTNVDFVNGIGALYARAALTFATSSVWTTGSAAIFCPVTVPSWATVKMMSVVTGATASGNIDVGIYDPLGQKRVSAGSTAQGTANLIQTFDITDTLLEPGLYYLACVMDNTTGTLLGQSSGTAGINRVTGCLYMAAAFPLPATATFAAVPTAFLKLPVISAHCQATV